MTLETEIRTNGYAIVRNLFTPEEIERIRIEIRRHFEAHGTPLGLGKTQPNAAIEVPALLWVFSLPKVVDSFRAALGTQEIVFTGHCDIHMNMLGGWHKDSGEDQGGYFRGDYFDAEDCRVYKMAIYLQDHHDLSGLTVRQSSHRTSSRIVGEERHLNSRAGDAVIFDVRLTHRGQRPDAVENMVYRLNHVAKGMKRNSPDWPLFTALKSAYWKLIGTPEKLSIFFTFGAKNAFTSDFARANMRRQISQTRHSAVNMPRELTSMLEKQGVEVFRYDQDEHQRQIIDGP